MAYWENGKISVRVQLVDPDITSPLPIIGTLTIDEITNAVHIEIDSGSIDIASIPNLTIVAMPNLNIATLPNVNIASMPNLTISDIVNLNVDSLPALTGTLAISSIGGTVTIGGTIAVSSIGGTVNMATVLSSGTPSAQSTILVSNSSITAIAANASRKRVTLYNYSNATTAPIFIHLAASAATTTNGWPITAGQSYTPPFNYTGEIRVISSTASNKELFIEEWI